MKPVAFAIACLALLAPVASAAPVDLYIHVNGFQDAPMTTAEPSDRWSQTVQLGLATHSGCVSDPADAQHFTDRQYHTWYAYQSPAEVKYDDGADARPHVLGLRGLLTDVVLGDTQPVVQWYMAADSLPRDDLPSGPAILPDFVLDVTWRLGSEISHDNVGFDDGPLLGRGTLGPFTLHPGVDQAGVTEHMVAGETVYGFTIPLDMKTLDIPREAGEDVGFNLRIDAYVDNPLCSDGHVMPDVLKVHTSPGLRPKLSFDVIDPVSITNLHAPTDAGLLMVVQAASPFGHGDVVLTVTSDLPIVLHDFNDGTYDCHSHCPPTAPRWTYALVDASSLPAGDHPVTITVENRQGTAQTSQTAWVRIADGTATFCPDEACLSSLTSDKGAPGLPVISMILLLAFLARRIS